VRGGASVVAVGIRAARPAVQALSATKTNPPANSFRTLSGYRGCRRSNATLGLALTRCEC
jgi:hypothetical protein